MHAYISGMSNFFTGYMRESLPYHDLPCSTGGLRQGQCKLLYHTLDCSDGNRFTYHTSHCIDHKDLDLARVDHFCHHELQLVESEIKRHGSTDHVVLHVTDFWHAHSRYLKMSHVIYKCRAYFINVASTSVWTTGNWTSKQASMHIQCREWKRCLRVLVHRSQFISTLDLAKGYWQIPMQAPSSDALWTSQCSSHIPTLTFTFETRIHPCTLGYNEAV